jgi:hypothetical protein
MEFSKRWKIYGGFKKETFLKSRLFADSPFESETNNSHDNQFCFIANNNFCF